MTRIKWVEIKTDASMKNIPMQLQECSYSPKINLSGFELLEVSKREIRAKFIQESTQSEVQIDPFGKEVTSTFTRYLTTIFSIVELRGLKLLRIDRPPRSLKDLVLALSKALNGDFFAQEVPLDVGKFLEYLKSRRELGKLRIRSALFVDVPLTESSTGRILVESSQDAIRDFKKRLSGGRLDRVNLELQNEFGISPLEVTNRGSMVVNDWLYEAALSEFDAHIAEQIADRG
ncbi:MULTISPECIES: hypothetical protein [unclassified Duganella]|uniref:hypothetical protein n=1 Tax=unclassified Duganella TaxID=2636909 RepID=UPI0011C11EF0|nr:MULTISPECIES: hypothetical protein [unclassified Duganella]